MADAWKITGGRTWCDKVVELEKDADRSIRSRDDGSFKVPLYAVPDGHVVVPREVLERFMQKIHNRTEYDDVKAARAELRALLSEQEGGRQ
ncbi:hypothetical protein IPC563_05305 [Pseudomonas aeruginosa]|uniref:hypothetical protein n=1 Tax=Pseudomonas aeruginosa TaxID=287 RepID=UPI000F53E39B|nr:hypothetical protein [Pseudomonas aeruginosa]RPZ37427.1 hypothetical protein IPC563_05305 [Pseudomonas aeruginosa]RUG83074.1 hypothetical protein IPC561_05320 [Pseudomonas aeruginosa]RUG96551.1 hypothetical protein IPC562_05750 [Pseudomonas aeruginosa]